MPRNESVIQVFVASPSDVKAEREALESVIQELNKIWSKKLRLRLDLNKWETDVYPGFGQDPQDVINRQIEDEYDIFIGILWGRIGTPTLRAESGTLEEFQRAYARHQEDPDSIDLMIYFKDAPIAPSKIDIEQLRKLQEFRSSLGEKGGLYWSFESLSNFESIIRSHLSLVAQRWTSKIASNYPNLALFDLISQQISTVESKEFEEDIELGIFDYYAALEEQAGCMETAMRLIGEATVDIGQQVQRRTDELLRLKGLTDRGAQKESEKVIKLAADDMNKYSSTLKNQLPKFSSSRDDVFESLSKALMLFRDFQTHENAEDGEDKYAALESQLLTLSEGISSAKEGIVHLKEAISSLPRVSSYFNKAKRNLVESLTNSLEEFDSTLDLIFNMQDTILQEKHEILDGIKGNAQDFTIHGTE